MKYITRNTQSRQKKVEVARMISRLFFLVGAGWFFSLFLTIGFAQEKTMKTRITGVVKSKAKPVPGALIFVEGLGLASEKVKDWTPVILDIVDGKLAKLFGAVQVGQPLIVRWPVTEYHRIVILSTNNTAVGRGPLQSTTEDRYVFKNPDLFMKVQSSTVAAINDDLAVVDSKYFVFSSEN